MTASLAERADALWRFLRGPKPFQMTDGHVVAHILAEFESIHTAARSEALEQCAKIAATHGPVMGREYKRKQALTFASDEARAEIFAEERGERIAAEIIAQAIRALKESANG